MIVHVLLVLASVLLLLAFLALPVLAAAACIKYIRGKS